MCRGAIRQNATISCSANKLEIKLPEVPANKFAIIVLYGHTPEVVSGHYWNTATITANDMETRTVSAQASSLAQMQVPRRVRSSLLQRRSMILPQR